MTPNSTPSSTAPSRRSFLATGAVAAVAVVGGVPLLAACGGSGSGSGSKEGTTTGKALKKVVPSYAPLNLVQPDVASVNGSSPGFTKLPDPLVVSVKSVPGKGSSFRVMTPLWGTVPKKNNPYYAAVNKAVGAKLNFDPQDGNTYQDKIGAVLMRLGHPGRHDHPRLEHAGADPQRDQRQVRGPDSLPGGRRRQEVPEPGEHPDGRLAVLGLRRQAARPADADADHRQRDLLPQGPHRLRRRAA